ncbi:hypothetical protein DPMN_153003 [Dreissena polymorpha]|uniref:Uncharacterized protein n=1 Tax=Dreissena polymorpha TaxID=45954 RepID=A0A9D4FMZ0_DREPO|nr:hypothetical protein DPMN_153003 [Dreissena polymorpha]
MVVKLVELIVVVMVAVLVVVVNRDYDDYDDYHYAFLEQLVVVVSIVMMITIVTVAADDVDDDYNDNDKGGISVGSEMADGKLIIAVVGGYDGSCCKSMAKINTISCVGQSNGAHLKSTHPLEIFSIHV